MKFNKTIKAAMLAQDVTAYRLCKDLGIDQSQFSRFLKLNAELSTRKLQQVFDYLGMII